jgi:hypothetical protein
MWARRLELVHRFVRLDVPAAAGVAAGPDAHRDHLKLEPRMPQDWNSFSLATATPAPV